MSEHTIRTTTELDMEGQDTDQVMANQVMGLGVLLSSVPSASWLQSSTQTNMDTSKTEVMARGALPMVKEATDRVQITTRVDTETGGILVPGMATEMRSLLKLTYRIMNEMVPTKVTRSHPQAATHSYPLREVKSVGLNL